MLLHHLQELDDHLRARTNQNLTLASLLGVVDGRERIIEYGRANHIGGCLRFSGRDCGLRYLHGHCVSLHEPFERKSALDFGGSEGSSARSKQAQRCHCHER